jgi:hypothetical protein
MPPALIDAVQELAEAAGEYPATIWRRAVALGISAAEAEVLKGRDLSNE